MKVERRNTRGGGLSGVNKRKEKERGKGKLTKMKRV